MCFPTSVRGYKQYIAIIHKTAPERPSATLHDNSDAVEGHLELRSLFVVRHSGDGLRVAGVVCLGSSCC